MAPKPWFQANIHAPGTGLALLTLAGCAVLQTAPMVWCYVSPEGGGFGSEPLSPARVMYCNGK